MNNKIPLGIISVLLLVIVATITLGTATTGLAMAAKPTSFDSNGVEVGWESVKDGCTTIQSGQLTYSPGHYLFGQPLQTGYDSYGYNYQAHMFKGSYFNVYSGGAGFPPYEGDDASYLAENPDAANHWAWPYRSTQLLMKWNDAWLANTDCDSDGLLDRHYGFDSYIGSGAWETNHMWDNYGADGHTCNWDYFTKIVAAPADATLDSGIWYSADGTEIGPVIWGDFVIVQEVYNDPCAGETGLSYNAPAPTGFGFYKP
jgi:hypothetical protein